MMQTKGKEGLNSKKIILIALKTFGYTFIVIMLFICSTFYLTPRLSLKISQVIGCKKAQESCYEKIYDKTNSISDLYNLVLIEQQLGDYKKELGYINAMLAKKEYSDFCKTLDSASLKTITSKELIPYSCDANAYIIGQKVTCMYKMGEDLDIFVLAQTSAGELTDLSLATYIDVIHNDDLLTNAQKIEMINSFKMQGLIKNSVYENSETIIEKRINQIKSELGEDNGLDREILLQYSLVRYYRANYLIYNYLDDEDQAETYKDLYNEENSKLVALY